MANSSQKRWWWGTAVLCLALGAWPALGQKSAAKAKSAPAGVAQAKTEPQEPGLAEPDYLPDLARAFLRKRMLNHREDMTELVMSVALLRYPQAKDAALRIASEPRLVRPIAGGENDLNAALPDQLFVLQDELRHQAKRVAEAAANKNDVELAKSFGRLTETCVSCHSAYVRPVQKK